MIKIIYIEQRRAGDSREYWARRWRMHGGFAMQFREFWDPVRIYVQNDCVADCSALAGADPGFGGIGAGDIGPECSQRAFIHERNVLCGVFFACYLFDAVKHGHVVAVGAGAP